MKKVISILCVCAGNTCRSPIMAALLQREFAVSGIDIDVQSVGISQVRGAPASTSTIQVMKSRSFDLSKHRSECIDYIPTKQLNDFTFIIVVNDEIKQKLLTSYYVDPRICLSLNPEIGIPNPNPRRYETYEECYYLISNEVHRFVRSFNNLTCSDLEVEKP